MKGFSRKGWLLAGVLCLFLTGCGESMLELTPEEEQTIVTYASGAVAKNNQLQDQGLTYLYPDPEESEKEKEPEATPENEEPEAQGQGSSDGQMAEPEQEMAANTVTLTEALGITPVTAEYAGYQLDSSYHEGDFFAAVANEGEMYLILNVRLYNPTDALVDCDVFSKNMVFKVAANGGDPIEALNVISMGSLTTYVKTLEAGATEDTVIICSIPEEWISNIQQLDLYIETSDGAASHVALGA